jgi:transposase
MIYLLSSIDIDKYSSKQFINMYLERWWVENIFKRVKTKFNLEAVRVLKYQRFLNLISLIQFAVIVVTLIFNQIQRSTNSLITWILVLYKRFIRLKSLTFNIDSFITYLNDHLEPLIFRNKPLEQMSLLSRRQLRKLTMSEL